MKKNILSLVLVLALLVPSFGMAAAYTDGAYSAAAKGMLSDVAVTVTVEGGAITAVTADVSGETPAIAGAAIEKVTAAIVANNDVTVDAVAGATLTSNRIMNAAAACLESAAQ